MAGTREVFDLRATQLTLPARQCSLAGSNKTGGRHGQDDGPGRAQSGPEHEAVSIRDSLAGSI